MIKRFLSPRSGLNENSPAIYRWDQFALVSMKSAKRTTELFIVTVLSPASRALNLTACNPALKCWAIVTCPLTRTVLALGAERRDFKQSSRKGAFQVLTTPARLNNA